MVNKKTLAFFAVLLYASALVQPLTGQPFPNLSQLLTTTGFVVPLRNTTTLVGLPADPVYQWLIPSFNFGPGLNITGWLFQAENVIGLDDSTLIKNNRAPLFTIWHAEHLNSEVPTDLYTRRNLNVTRASIIRKIKGVSPSLYYYEMEEMVVTEDRDTFGILQTNQTIGVHVTFTKENTFGDRVITNSSTDTCEGQFGRIYCIDALYFYDISFKRYIPLVTPIFGESFEEITERIHTSLGTTTAAPLDLTTNSNKETLKWIIVGAAFGAVIVLVGVVVTTVIVTIVVQRSRHRMKKNKKRKRRVSKNHQLTANLEKYDSEVIDSDKVIESESATSGLTASYHLVKDEKITRGEIAATQVNEGDEKSGNTVCSEEEDHVYSDQQLETKQGALEFQLIQNAAYDQVGNWHISGNQDRGGRTVESDEETESGYVINELIQLSTPRGLYNAGQSNSASAGENHYI